MNDPEKVLAEALAKRYVPLGGVAPFTTDAAAILAAMPDHTIIRRSDLAALRAVAEAAEKLTEVAELIENPPTTEAGRAFDMIRAALQANIKILNRRKA